MKDKNAETAIESNGHANATGEGARYMTKKEAATYLRVSERTLDRLIASGDIIGARISGRRLLFDRDQVDGYIRRKFQEAIQ